MKFIKRPQQPCLPERLIVKNSNDYKKLDKVWKQLLIENNEREHTNIFASICIFRNLLLGRDMYTGFTPYLQQTSLENGRAFCGGFSYPLMKLKSSIQSNYVNELQIACYRMIIALQGFTNISSLIKQFPEDNELHCFEGGNNYICRIQDMIIRKQSDGQSLQGMSYKDLFDMYDSEEKYNLIHKDDYPALKEDGKELEKVLNSFGYMFMQANQEMKDFKLGEIELTDNCPDWMFYNNKGEDVRMNKDDDAIIILNIYPKYYSTTDTKGKIYLPISYLWETEWMEEYNK